VWLYVVVGGDGGGGGGGACAQQRVAGGGGSDSTGGAGSDTTTRKSWTNSERSERDETGAGLEHECERPESSDTHKASKHPST